MNTLPVCWPISRPAHTDDTRNIGTKEMTEKRIPTPEEFFLHIPLYEVIEWSGEKVFDVLNVLHFQGTIDSYCISCGKVSTFKGVQQSIPAERSRERYKKIKSIGSTVEPPLIPTGTYEVNFICARNQSHKHMFIFLATQNILIEDRKRKPVSSIQKIGQYPSYGDLNIPKVKMCSPILSKEDMGELVRAIGLASHDVGVGSYVYLRRVFERLVETAHKEVAKDRDWDEEKYLKSRMKEKIQLLSNELPDFLVEHPEMYSLLSKGVHELSEQECLKHFDALKIAIELILDEKLEENKKAQKIAKAKKSITKAIEKVNRERGQISP